MCLAEKMAALKEGHEFSKFLDFPDWPHSPMNGPEMEELTKNFTREWRIKTIIF